MTGTTGGVLLLIEDDDSIGQLVKRYLDEVRPDDGASK